MSDLVNFKGMGDGVRIWLDSAAEFEAITDELQAKINASKAFFGDGDCSLRFFGRRMSESERGRLEKITLELLPSARISYERTHEHKPYAWLVENAHHRDEVIEHPAEPIIDNGADNEKEEDTRDKYTGTTVVSEEELFSVFRSNRARLYQGIAKPGMVIRSDGHLVFFGKVEKGASLIAVGNILVIGGLYGSAHAGCNGHDGSYILAMDMKPEKLAIADLEEEYPDIPDTHTEGSKNTEKKGLFDKFRKKTRTDAAKETADIKNINDDTFSAVALCKKHKIEIDNFTIRTFTNG